MKENSQQCLKANKLQLTRFAILEGVFLKASLIVILLSMLAPGAFASEETFTPDVPVVMNLGTAPYRGSVSAKMILSNAGPSDLTNISHSVNSPAFTARNNCPKVLAPQKSCKITVTFTAFFSGYASATMKVRTSDKNYIVSLSAYGQDDPWRNMPPNPPVPPRPPVFPRP